MQPGLSDPRIERMYRGDRIWSFVAVIVLWITLLFVFLRVTSGSATGGVVVALAVSGALVLLFNTASIAALLKHYTQDKAHLYGLDLHYIDEAKKGRL